MKAILSLLLFINVLVTPVYAEETVVARVNGSAVLLKDLEAQIDTLLPRSTFHGNVSEEKREEFREKALEMLIDRELQYQEAVAKGLPIDAAVVNGQLDIIKDGFKTKNEFKAALKKAGLTESDLRTRIEKSFLAAAAVAKSVSDPSRVSDSDLKAYYADNKEKFKQPESVRLRIITIKESSKAENALKRIKSGVDFGLVASETSEDDYRIKGGDIGYQHRGRLLPEIEAQAFTLKVSEVSKIIKTESMNFIIKLEDKKPEYQIGFDEIKEKLKKELEEKQAGTHMQAWMAGLRSKAKIELVKK